VDVEALGMEGWNCSAVARACITRPRGTMLECMPFAGLFGMYIMVVSAVGLAVYNRMKRRRKRKGSIHRLQDNPQSPVRMR
jgi:hypothetical protein